MIFVLFNTVITIDLYRKDRPSRENVDAESIT